MKFWVILSWPEYPCITASSCEIKKYLSQLLPVLLCDVQHSKVLAVTKHM